MAGPDVPRRPSRLLLGLEAARSALEFAVFTAAWPAFGSGPRGDGHGVLLLPGWLAGDLTTAPLRQLLRRLGYSAHGWELGRNMGATDATHDGLPRRLLELHEATGAPVSVVGMSLGGVLARRLARDRPGLVRRVITMGSPFRQYERGAAPLAVPATAIYTRGDGIVDWRSCRDPDGPGADNVEVIGSHCGLGHNPLAVRIVTDRLARAVGAARWNR